MSNLEEVMEGAKQVFESTEMSEYNLGQLNTQNTTIYEQVSLKTCKIEIISIIQVMFLIRRPKKHYQMIGCKY